MNKTEAENKNKEEKRKKGKKKDRKKREGAITNGKNKSDREDK